MLILMLILFDYYDASSGSGKDLHYVNGLQSVESKIYAMYTSIISGHGLSHFYQAISAKYYSLRALLLMHYAGGIKGPARLLKLYHTTVTSLSTATLVTNCIPIYYVNSMFALMKLLLSH